MMKRVLHLAVLVGLMLALPWFVDTGRAQESDPQRRDGIVASISGLPSPSEGGDIVAKFRSSHFELRPSSDNDKEASGSSTDWEWPNGKVAISYSKRAGVDYVEIYSEDGDLLVGGEVKAGMPHGKWTWYGAQLVRCRYLEGVIVGTCYITDEAGMPKDILTYKDGKLSGASYGFCEGQLVLRSEYVAGKLDGMMIEYDDNGRVLRETVYKEGVQTSKSK